MENVDQKIKNLESQFDCLSNFLAEQKKEFLKGKAGKVAINMKYARGLYDYIIESVDEFDDLQRSKRCK